MNNQINNMHKEVVIDANILIKRVVPEELTEEAKALLSKFRQEGILLIAPSFFLAEVDSILRKKVVAKKELTLAQAQSSWEKLQEIPVELADMSIIRHRAWEISIELQHAHVYDSVYLALAELQGCDFWTADQRLYNAVRDRFSFIKSLKEFTP